MGIQNRRDRHIPPFGLAAKGTEKADKVSGSACQRRVDGGLCRLLVAAFPQVDPGLVQKRPDVFYAKQLLSAQHGQQISFQVQHLDAVRAAFNDAAVKPLALAQGFLRQVALGDVLENNRQPTTAGIFHFYSVDFQGPYPGYQFTFESDRLAGSEKRVVALVPVLGDAWKQLPDGFPHHATCAVHTGLAHKCRVDFDVAKIQRCAGWALQLFDNAKAVVHRFEKCAVALFADANFRAQFFYRQAGPDRLFHQSERKLALLLRCFQRLHRLVRRRCKPAHTFKLSQVLGVELAAIVMGNHPDRAYRFPLDAKRHQQTLLGQRQ